MPCCHHPPPELAVDLRIIINSSFPNNETEPCKNQNLIDEIIIIIIIISTPLPWSKHAIIAIRKGKSLRKYNLGL